MKLATLLGNIYQDQRLVIIEYPTMKMIYEGKAAFVINRMDIRRRYIAWFESCLKYKDTKREEVSSALKVYVSKREKL